MRSGHTGAQGRAKGFHSVVDKYPDIKVLDEQPADWDVTKVSRIWDSLLTKYPDINRPPSSTMTTWPWRPQT